MLRVSGGQAPLQSLLSLISVQQVGEMCVYAWAFVLGECLEERIDLKQPHYSVKERKTHNKLIQTQRQESEQFYIPRMGTDNFLKG